MFKLDNDLYKFTMQQAVLQLYPNVQAKYKFINRGAQRFNDRFLHELRNRIKAMKYAAVDGWSLEKFGELPFITPWYKAYIDRFRFNPGQVSIDLDSDNNLMIDVEGSWHSTILWEVPLMAMVSELYFKYVDEDWSKSEQVQRINSKGETLTYADCEFSDFGTRRRRSFDTQEMVVRELRKHKGFKGTSNVHLAFQHGLNPVGTMAHEWTQAIAVLESMNHPNRFMMDKWLEVYGSQLGIVLTDTYGTDAFLKDFTAPYAKAFDGVRHDSGPAVLFAAKMADNYDDLGINPGHKKIVFSDGLNCDRAINIRGYCEKIGIGRFFGIGTHFTNDFPDSPALNMVVKLWEINGENTVKLSDVDGKNCGEPDAVKLYKAIHLNDRPVG